MLDAISASKIHEIDDDPMVSGTTTRVSGTASRTTAAALEAALDPHATKVSPDSPGLALKQAGGRLLRKGPIGALVVGTFLVALVAAVKGLDSAGAGIAEAASTPQPIEPQAPVAPNLEVSDLVRNAPGNNSPVLIPKLKQAAVQPGPPAPPTPPNDVHRATEAIPDLSRPPPGGGDHGNGGQPGMMAGPSPAQEARRAAAEARRAERDQALVADMMPEGEGSGASEAPAGAQRGNQPAMMQGLPPGYGMPPAAGDPAGGSMQVPVGRGVTADNPGQAQKKAFLADDSQGTQAEGGYRVIRQPVSPYRMRAGWVIPCALKGALNSDQPGKVVAQVTENVYDSVTGRHLLIPQGATVTGSENSSVAYGQERAQVCWSLLERDDGVSVDLGCSPAYDRSGAAGVPGEVNNHYGKLITGVLLSSLLGAVTQTVAGDMQNYRPTVMQGFAQGAASEFGSAGQQITRRNLNIQPTLTTKLAAEVIVLLERPVIMPPYRQPVIRE
jgi:type IV secretory pathway VirB10-like protein